MTSRLARLTGWGLLALVLVAVAFAGWWRLSGGRIERVETPSMGTVAPVGSLLWVRPVDTDTLRPGDFITFHPPGDPSRTYSHRVLHVYADGTLDTQGEITAPDPWRLGSDDVVGRVVMTWHGAGWAILCAPLVALGGCVVGLVASRSRERWRATVVLVGASAVAALVIVVYRPLTNAEQLAFTPVHEGARATYVSTGLLPMRLQADGGGHVDLGDGERGSVVVPGSGDRKHYAVSLAPAVPWPFWVGLVGVCFVPALGSTASRLWRRRATGVDARRLGAAS